MELTHEKKGDTHVVRLLERKLATNQAPEFKKEILELLVDSDVKNLVFSMSEVESIDSSGLGALLLARRQVAERGGRCGIVAPGEKVLFLMKIARLEEVFSTFDDEDSALKSFAG